MKYNSKLLMTSTMCSHFNCQQRFPISRGSYESELLITTMNVSDSKAEGTPGIYCPSNKGLDNRIESVVKKLQVARGKSTSLYRQRQFTKRIQNIRVIGEKFRNNMRSCHTKHCDLVNILSAAVQEERESVKSGEKPRLNPDLSRAEYELVQLLLSMEKSDKMPNISIWLMEGACHQQLVVENGCEED